MSNRKNGEEKYIGFYLPVQFFNKIVEIAKLKTIETNVKHSKSDVLRIAVYDLLKKYEKIAN